MSYFHRRPGRASTRGYSTRATADARREHWMRQYSEMLVMLAPTVAGRIDWDTAAHLFNTGADAAKAAEGMADTERARVAKLDAGTGPYQWGEGAKSARSSERAAESSWLAGMGD